MKDIKYFVGATLNFMFLVGSSVAALFLGFPYLTVDTMDDPTFFHVLISCIFFSGIIIAIIRSYGKKQEEMLFSIGAACAVSALGCAFTSSLLQPLFYALTFGMGSFFILVMPILSYIGFSAASFILAAKCKNSDVTEVKQILKVLAVTFTVLTALISGIFASINGFGGDNIVYRIVKSCIEVKENTRLYESIDGTMSYNEVKELLESNGYFNSDEDESIDDSGNKRFVRKGGERYYAEISVSDTGDLPISYKYYNLGDEVRYGLWGREFHSDACVLESFNNLKNGMTKKKAMDTINTDNIDLSYTETYYSNGTKNETVYYRNDFSNIDDWSEDFYTVTLEFTDDILTDSEITPAFSEDEDCILFGD